MLSEGLVLQSISKAGLALRSFNEAGPLAHLVERFHGMEEVSGSSPLWSTTSLRKRSFEVRALTHPYYLIIRNAK